MFSLESESVSYLVMSDSLRPPSLSKEFSRQEYWRGLPFPSPGDRLNQEIKMGVLYCSKGYYQFTFPPIVQEGSLFYTFSPAFIVCRFIGDGHSDRVEIFKNQSFISQIQ